MPWNLGRGTLAAVLLVGLSFWPVTGSTGATTAAAVKGAPHPKPLRFTCAEAFADGTLTDPRQAGALAAVAAGLTWTGADPFGAPADCHRSVRLFCGPDLDHDGDTEAIVEVSWRFTDDCAASQNEDGDFVPVTKTFLASRHGAVWRAVAPLAIASGDEAARATETSGDGDGRVPSGASPRSYFVRRPGGETAVRVEWLNAASEAGCAIGRYELFALRAGVLRRLEAGDASPHCVPCGCK